MPLGVAIVGCGLIGLKRAQSLRGGRLVACADVNRERAEALARVAAGARATDDWRTAIDRRDVDVVVVSTTNDALSTIAVAAITAGKHVLVEKPAGRSVAEIDVLLQAATRLHQHSSPPGLVSAGFSASSERSTRIPEFRTGNKVAPIV